MTVRVVVSHGWEFMTRQAIRSTDDNEANREPRLHRESPGAVDELAARRASMVAEAGEEEACPWRDLQPGGTNLRLEDFLTFILGRLGNAGQRVITARYLEPFDVTVTEWRMLAALAAFAPMSFGKLVEVSSSDKALVSRTLRRLAERGLAVAEQDPANARKVVCAITEEGRALYRKILPVAQQRQAELLGVLSEDERVALYRILHKLDRVLEPDRPRHARTSST